MSRRVDVDLGSGARAGRPGPAQHVAHVVERQRRGHQPAGVDRPRGVQLDRADPAEFTILTVPERLSTTGDPWAAMGEKPASIDVLLEWWTRDAENGLGELPFPPDYPKMPGEPPRVQPSRAKKPS